MQKILTKFFFLAFIMLSFSAPVHAEISFTSGWHALMRFLHLDLAREVNSYVTPAAPQCTDYEIGNRVLEGTPVLEPASPIETIAQEETIVKVLTLREQIMDNYTKLGGDPIALEQSLCFFDKYKATKFKAAGDPSRATGIKIDNQRYITINDLNSSMSKSRFYVIDMETGKVNTYFSSHGYGGRKGVPESDMVAEGLSNVDGSYATPRGFFITGNRRDGSSDPRWKFSMKLHGLQQGVNDKSFSRAIIMHPFPNMPDESASSDDQEVSGAVRSDGPFSLSRGCPMLSEKYASEIINKIKSPTKSSGGSLYYNYSAEEKSRGPSYCGEEGLMKK
jgi:hypothetical protein